MRLKFGLAALSLLSAAVTTTATWAQASPPAQTKVELQAAWAAAKTTATLGPADIKLMDQADLRLAPDQVFIPATQANRIMAAMGNQTTPARYGLVVSRKNNAQWLVDVTWVKEGYVRDGDAKEWQPDALLDNLKQGTEQGNTERLAKGLPALDVVGWVEKPSYDAATHRLVWSLSLRDRGASAAEPQTINYNTYALGRDGYFSLDLITGSNSIAADKQVASNLLGSLNYVPGKRYQDFNGSTDKVAAYGLAALIGVVAVKKLGLLAVISVFLLKVWKLGLLALAAVGSAFRRFLKRGHTPDADA
jgi:uncharacterized membrane-anchored protein